MRGVRHRHVDLYWIVSIVYTGRVGAARIRQSRRHMVTEFDLPCTACGHALAATTVAAESGEGSVTVAECPNCGIRHYPESALER